MHRYEGPHGCGRRDQTGRRDGYHKSVVLEKQVPQVPQCGTKCGTMCGALKKFFFGVIQAELGYK